RDPLLFISAINTIHSGRSTALFDGWLAGATEVAKQLDPQGLNRVLLLSDGQANQGLTDAAAIAAKVKGLTQRGISTSAFGLGSGFDEDLMGAVAAAGDGTLAQIESPQHARCQLRWRLALTTLAGCPPVPPPAMAGGGDSEN
ncbi:MAG: vWA domain-containing protein, partial [Cyanobium sp.]